MNHRYFTLAILTLLLSACAIPATESNPGVQSDGDALTPEVKALHDAAKVDVIASAEKMPAEYFDFQPTPEVRSFGQIVGHIATTLYDYCSAVGASGNPNTGLIEENVSGKADLVNALKAAYDYCEEALAPLTDVTGMEKVTAWREGTRFGFLALEIAHTNLHYGNMTTYMRLKESIPSSTERRVRCSPKFGQVAKV